MSTTTLPSSPPVWEGVSLGKRALWRAEGFFVRHRDFIIIVGLLVLALVARLWINRGLWLDEATSAAQAQMDFGRMLSYLRESDVHPPLFHAILWADVRLFGTSELAVRAPSLFFGTALVPLLYWTARDLFDRRTGLVAALIGALGPATIWYSQEARMYPMFMFFALLAVWMQVRAVRTGSWKAWAGYSLATAALFWTHYFSALHILVQQVAFLALIWQGRGTAEGRKLLGSWIRSALLIALLVVPLLSLPLGQIANYGIRDTTTVKANGAVDSGAPLYTAISNLASALVGYHSTSTMTKINALWPLGMLAALMALGRGRTRVSALLTALIFVPLAVLFVVGLSRNDVFELRYFAGAVPVMALLVARAVTTLARTGVAMAVACSLIVASLSVALIDEQRDGGNSRLFDFRGALTEVNAQQQPGDLLLYEPFYLHPTVHYYAPKYTSFPLITGLESTTEPSRIIVVGSLAFAERERSQARIAQVVDRLNTDRTLVQHIQRNNIEVWVFA